MLVAPISFPPVNEARCIAVGFGEDSMIVRLEDGRSLEVPLACFPFLAQAAEGERANWRLVGSGIGIHWPDIDEDISVAELLGGSY
jgi:hypothetical protein